MIKTNYASWHINPKVFSEAWSDIEKLQFIARYAILAPSGHNSQPWHLTVNKNTIVVTINKSHFLSGDGSGLLSVEPYISIGTFLEVFSLASRGFGYQLELRLFPHDGQIAQISIERQIPAEPDLLPAIVTRVSNRNPFIQTSIEEKTLSMLTSGKFSGVESTMVTQIQDVKFIAEQTRIAIESINSNSLYRKELSAWIRTNHTRKYDGMPGFTHGFGNFKSLISRLAVRHMPKHGPQARKSSELIIQSGALIIVSCTDNKKESFINAGRLYSQICIFANKMGFATSALGASVIDTETRDMVKRYFNIKGRPIYILRLGKATKNVRHSPRWPLDKLLNHEVS